MVSGLGKQVLRMLSRVIITMAAGVFAVAGLADCACAFSELIPTKISLLKWGGQPPAGRLYKMVSKAPNPPLFQLPHPVTSDPIANGGSVTVTVGDQTLACTLAPGALAGSQGWKGLGNPAGSKGYKYMNKLAPTNDPCKIVIVKEKVIKLLAKGVGDIDPPAPQGTNPDVKMRMTVGTDGYCALALAPHFKEKADTLIKMKSQPPPPPGCGNECVEGTEQCDGAAVAGSDCPGVCEVNCTCPAPVCGNGSKEAGEGCDPPCEQGVCDNGEICGGFCECVPDVPCECGSTEPTMYRFTNKAPTEAVCGATDGTPPIDELACMGLYIGGSGGGLVLPYLIPDEGTTKYKVECCQGTNMALTRKTKAEVGIASCSEGRKCSAESDNAGEPCLRDRQCPNGSCEIRCYFSAPLATLDRNLPPLSTCTQNEIMEDSLGGLDCETGRVVLHQPLISKVHLSLVDNSPSIPSFQACPVCYGGTLGVAGSGTCEGGPNSGLPCMPQSTPWEMEECCAGGSNNTKPCSDDSDCPGSTCVFGCTQYPTSLDCPPNPLLEVGNIPVPQTLSTETSTLTTNEEGEFCGWCRDVEVEGSFCFEGDPDLGPPAGASSCPDSVTIVCRPATYHGPGGGDPADIFDCEDNVPCKADADCTAPYETCTQRNPGAFHDATATSISYEGIRGGDLRAPGSHRGMIAAAFCIGSTFTPANDSQGDLPGPAGMALDVEMQLSPGGAFLDGWPALLD